MTSRLASESWKRLWINSCQISTSADKSAQESTTVEGMQKGANIAKKKIGKLERTSLGAELDMAGRSVEHSMARLGESTMSNVHRDR